MKRKQSHPGFKSKTKAGSGPEKHPPSLGDAIALLRANRLGEAAASLRAITATDPANWQAAHLLGLTAYRLGQRQEAASLLQRCVDLNPDLAEAHSDLGAVLKELGRLDEAYTACNTAIALKPVFYPAHTNLGNVLKAQGRIEDAVESYKVALALEPNSAEAHANLGTTLVMLGRAHDAVGHCRRAAALMPQSAEVQMALGHALHQDGKPHEAETAFRRAIELKPALSPAYSDLGWVLQDLGKFEAALEAHEQALTLEPDSAEANNSFGVTLKALGRYAQAEEAYRKAIALRPAFSAPWSNLGAILDLTGRHDEAVAAHRRAVELSPQDPVPYFNLAGSQADHGKLAEAIALYAKVLAIDPGHPAALVEHYSLRRHACDWLNLAAAEDRVLQYTCRAGQRVPPFPLLNIPCSAEDHLQAGRNWAAGLVRPVEKPFDHAPPRKHGKGRLRIGYLSADYHEHAIASLIAELFESHDRSRFEIFGYCFSRDDQTGTRKRVVSAFDHFVPVGELSHGDSARRIHADGIDILVDLKGYSAGARTEIVACRPAPIQVNFLGYPATMGANFIDYIIADPFTLPMDQAPYYDEKIVHLPHCYQPNDTKRSISATTPSRADCGLPENAFVFCCFNAAYKISPQRFAVWMRLLREVPGSVLWLLETNSLASANLRREAMAHGVDPARLVFAPKAELPKHLARHCQADLFLDTAPIGAHTTASDALWAGLPVLTCAGDKFVSRVCGSLVHAAGLPELVMGTEEEYEAAALRLARTPDELRTLRERLIRNRLAAPLFDSTRFTRDLEAAFDYMADLHAAGHEPGAFAVAEIGNEPVKPRTAAPKAPPHVQPASTAPAAAPSAARTSRIAYEACPLCGSESMASYRETDCSKHECYAPGLPPVMIWNRCQTCGHIFTAGYFSPEAAEAVFGITLPHQRVGHDVERQRLVSARMIERIIPHVPKSPPPPRPRGESGKLLPREAAYRNGALGDWLDVGFGNGSLVFTAQEWGFHAVGLELRRESVQALTSLGYEAYLSSIEDVNFAARFSVISMADVLEHTPFPKTTLTAAYNLLCPKGVLFLSMPNMESIVWRVLDAQGQNPYWAELEHYHNFSRARLYALLEELGFVPQAYHVSERYKACMEVIAIRR